jgi:potassium channel subfamily K, other eukaryote
MLMANLFLVLFPGGDRQAVSESAGDAAQKERDEILAEDLAEEEEDIMLDMEEDEESSEDGSGAPLDDGNPQKGSSEKASSHRAPSSHHARPPTPQKIISYEPADKPSWWKQFKELLNTTTSEEEVEDYIPNYRLIPILSGLIIPFSILLEIPGLTEHWYIRTEGNDIVETHPNTVILNVGLAISMVCALLANVALIARFLEKRVKTMTFICVIALTIHGASRVTSPQGRPLIFLSSF